MKRGLAFALLLAWAPVARAQGPELDSPAVRAGLDAIRPAALESHLRFLADDLLEGRGTGTRGYDLAARYVASRFQALGLEPGGVNETWFQPLPFRRADVLRGRCQFTLLRRGAATQLVLGRDYLMGADTYRSESEVTGDLVYVGYGISAPRLGLALVPDPSPEENIFVRSDQYSFVRHGVPSLFLVGRSGGEAEEKLKTWRRTIYHTPQDDLTQPMDFESLAKFARANYLVGYLVANRTRRPAWNAGDFFGERFGGLASARP